MLVRGYGNMHCLSCNIELTDFEATIKDTDGVFLDLCTECLENVDEDYDIDVRVDLMQEADYTLESLDTLEFIGQLDFNNYN